MLYTVIDIGRLKEYIVTNIIQYNLSRILIFTVPFQRKKNLLPTLYYLHNYLNCHLRAIFGKRWQWKRSFLFMWKLEYNTFGMFPGFLPWTKWIVWNYWILFLNFHYTVVVNLRFEIRNLSRLLKQSVSIRYVLFLQGWISSNRYLRLERKM